MDLFGKSADALTPALSCRRGIKKAYICAMRTKTSKAQKEVCEWKESLYEELRAIPRFKKLKYLHEKVKGTLEYLKKKQPRVFGA